MCGIAGAAGLSSAADAQTALDAMAGAMRHRGPDDHGTTVVAEGTGVCATRLAIQDPSQAGHQPMTSERTGTVVALNGELYNVHELRRELEGLGHRFHGHSDTEVILHAYDEWGKASIARLRGMYGLAIWDAPERRLVIARDRLGIKPLYVWEDGGRLLVASELRALLAPGLIERRISPAGLATYLALGAVQEPETLLEGVRMLAPGHLATWRGDGRGLEVERYWSLRDAFAEVDASTTRAEAVARLRELLEESVKQHLVSDRPLGVFLSGGIDSSALVGLVSHVHAPPHTVSVVFPEEEYSEERYIRQVSERFGTEHTSIRMEVDDVLREVPDALAAMDQPTMDGVNTFIVSRAAIEAGLTVALSGLGGDELFGGYPSFRDVPRLDRIRSLTPGFAGRLAAPAVLRAGRGSDRFDKLARWLRAAETEQDAYALRRELFGRAAAVRLLRGRNGVPSWHLPDPVDDERNSVSLRELDVYMRNVLLRDSDVMSMAHSLEIRVPFLDHVVVEHAARLQGDWKQPEPTPKALLVDALPDLLPHEVVHRPKMGFTLPFEHWMRGPLRADVERALTDGDFGGEVGAALDPAAVREVWAKFERGQTQWMRPWSLYALKTWGERHLPRRESALSSAAA